MQIKKAGAYAQPKRATMESVPDSVNRPINRDSLSTGMTVARAIIFGGIAGAVVWYLRT